MSQEIEPTTGFHSMAAIGFPTLEHTPAAKTPKGRMFIWLRAVGEGAVHVELPKQFEDKVKLFDLFAKVAS